MADLTFECTDFPETPTPEILRSEVLETIEIFFSRGVPVFVIDGEEGMGKTTLAAQFARRHPDRTISLFVHPTSRLTIDPAYLQMELARQVYLASTNRPLAGQELSDPFLVNTVAALHRRARQERKPYYFVIDGVAELKETDAYIKDVVLRDYLNLSHDWFRFLLTGDPVTLFAGFKTAPVHKSHILSRLDWNETRDFFSSLNLEETSLGLVEAVCRGNPSRLSQVRRILLDVADRSHVLDVLHSNSPNLFEYEWKRADASNRSTKFALATLAHDSRRYTIDYLAKVAEVDSGVLSSALKLMSFIQIEEPNGCVSYVSEPHRRFAAERLRALEPLVNNRIIDLLVEDRSDESTILVLPTYLQKTNRLDDLLAYLGSDHIIQFMERTKSLSLLRQRVRLGKVTARQLKKSTDLLRFSLQDSAIQGITGVDVWGAEVAALSEVGDYQRASIVAQSAILKEDALQLLSIIAACQKRKSREVDPELTSQIKAIYDQLDPAEIGERCIDIACELMACFPELAILLVERSIKADSGMQTMDVAFTRLSLSATGTDTTRAEQTSNLALHTRIKSDRLRQMSAAMAVISREASAKEVIAETSAMERITDRMYVLRHWTSANASKDGAIDVSDFAIRSAILGGEYSPNALVFRQFAAPLRFSPDSEMLRALVKTLHNQATTAERDGPTIEYVRLQLTIATAEMKFDTVSAGHRLLELYDYCLKLSNLYTKAEAFAWLLGGVTSIDPEDTLEGSLGLTSTIAAELSLNVTSLLEQTADHLEAAKPVVRALTLNNLELALEIVSSLNTEDRRDEALDEMLEKLLRAPDNKLRGESLRLLIDRYANDDSKEEALVKIAVRLSQVTNDVPHLLSWLEKALANLRNIKSLANRCAAYGDLYAFVSSQNRSSGLLPKLLDWQREAWLAIDNVWAKTTVGFEIVRDLARHNLEEAKKYLEEITAARFAGSGMEHIPVPGFVLSLQLAIRAWTGLLNVDHIYKELLDRLLRAIDQIPAPSRRIRLYADLALRCALNNRLDDCRKLVLEKVDVLLKDQISDRMALEASLISAAPALFFTYHQGSFDRFSILSTDDKDEAYRRICEAFLRKQSPEEPFDRIPEKGFPIDHPDLLSVVDLISRMESDSLVYRYITLVCDSIADVSVTRITRQQASEYPDKLTAIVNAKFPNARFIKHEGFRIAATAQINRLKGGSRQPWAHLVELAIKIPNVADRAYVLTIISACLPARENDQKRQILKDALEIIDKLPDGNDKASRYIDVPDLVRGDSALSRECLRKAMALCSKRIDTEDTWSFQRRIIDLAYRINADFASSLVSLIDDDPARARMREQAKNRVDTLKLRGDLRKSPENVPKNFINPKLPSAAWLNLGELNADPNSSVHPDELINWAEAAGNYSFEVAYPICAWVIENSVVRYRRENLAASRLVPIFDAIMLTAELTLRVATRSGVDLRTGEEIWASIEGEDVLMVGPGDRDKALAFVEAWLRRAAKDHVWIVDQYFSLQELEFLKLIKNIDPDLRVQVLTSRQQQQKEKVPQPYKKAFADYWSNRLSTEEPPETEIWVAAVGSGGESPIHDRWILTENGGLELGTSLNSIGISSECKISVMSAEEFAKCNERTTKYLLRRRREHRGETVSYEAIML